MKRDEFMEKVKAEIDLIMTSRKNAIMNLIEQAWAEGKRNAELDEITDIVKKALDRAQPSYQVKTNYPNPDLVSSWITTTNHCDTAGAKLETHSDNVAKTPHITSIMFCKNCGKTWVAIRPLVTKDAELECPHCHRQGTAVETGLPIDPGVSGDADIAD